MGKILFLRDSAAFFAGLNPELRRSLTSLTFLFGLYVAIGIANPVFFSPASIRALAMQGSLLLLVSLGATFVVMMGMIDLSVGSLVTFSAMAVAVIHGWAGGWAIPLAMVLTTLIGVGTGLIVTLWRLPSFLVTLGTLSVIQGLALLLGGSYVLFGSDTVTALTNSSLGAVPISVVWALVPLIIFSWFAIWTKFGRGATAIGGNEKVAGIAGIPIRSYKIIAFGLSALTCSVAGLILAGQIGAGTPSVGSGVLLDAIAAIAVGGVALSGGRGGPWSTAIGAGIITVLSAGLVVLQVDPNIQGVVKGLIVIVAVYFTLDRTRGLIVK